MSRPSLLLLLTHLAATWFMAGVIGFVQGVHYPLMARVEPAHFGAYEDEHRARTLPVVIAPMVVELATAVWLWHRPPRPADRWGWAVCLTLVLAIWVLTFLVLVPRHLRLAQGFDAPTHAELLAWNGVRMSLWFARAVGVTLLAGKSLLPALTTTPPV